MYTKQNPPLTRLTATLQDYLDGRTIGKLIKLDIEPLLNKAEENGVLEHMASYISRFMPRLRKEIVRCMPAILASRKQNIPFTNQATITTYDLSSLSLAARTLGNTPTGNEIQALYDRLCAAHPEIIV